MDEADRLAFYQHLRQAQQDGLARVQVPADRTPQPASDRADPKRVEDFKQMLADRRTQALATYGSTDNDREERSRRLQAILKSREQRQEAEKMAKDSDMLEQLTEELKRESRLSVHHSSGDMGEGQFQDDVSATPVPSRTSLLSASPEPAGSMELPGEYSERSSQSIGERSAPSMPRDDETRRADHLSGAQRAALEKFGGGFASDDGPTEDEGNGGGVDASEASRYQEALMEQLNSVVSEYKEGANVSLDQMDIGLDIEELKNDSVPDDYERYIAARRAGASAEAWGADGRQARQKQYGQDPFHNVDHDGTGSPPMMEPSKSSSPRRKHMRQEGGPSGAQYTPPVHERLHNMSKTKDLNRELQRRRVMNDEMKEVTWRPSISDKSRTIAGDRNVEVWDALEMKKRQTEQQLEAMRLNKAKEEMREIKKTQISKKSKEMVRRDKSVFEILSEDAEKARERKEKMAKQKEAEDKSQLQAAPAINPVSHSMPWKVENVFKWNEKRHQKIQALRRQEEQKEAENYAEAPKISAKSQALTKKMDRRGNIGDRLNAQGELSRARKEEARRLKEMEDQLKARPEISIHSANLERTEKVGARLYRSAKEQRARVQQAQADEEERTRQASGLQINDVSKGMVRNRKVEDILTQKGLEYEEKKRRFAEEVESEVEQSTRAPKFVNYYSHLLVEMMERRTNTTAQERLTKSAKGLSEATLADLDREEANLTFQPAINVKSTELDQASNNFTGNRADLLYKRAKDYDERKNRLRAEKEKKEMEACTFNPNLSASEEPRRAKTAKAQLPGKDIAQRNAEWLAEKEAKKQRALEEKNREEAEACTFRPTLSNTSGRAGNTSQRSLRTKASPAGSQAPRPGSAKKSAYSNRPMSPQQSTKAVRSPDRDGWVGGGRRTDPASDHQSEAESGEFFAAAGPSESLGGYAHSGFAPSPRAEGYADGRGGYETRSHGRGGAQDHSPSPYLDPKMFEQLLSSTVSESIARHYSQKYSEMAGAEGGVDPSEIEEKMRNIAFQSEGSQPASRLLLVNKPEGRP